jgi:uncharacterized protein YdeI (YjbR/CyaY-like superfamily)
MSALKRKRYPMPNFIKEALEQRDLMASYLKRPDYQQNDYIGWITRAKQDATKTKRLNQMLGELKHGDKYMNMPYNTK